MRRLTLPTLGFCALLFCGGLASSGCDGSLDHHAMTEETPPPGVMPPPADSDPTQDPDPVDDPVMPPDEMMPATACAALEVELPPMRRLTRAEYLYTVQDVLGVDPTLIGAFSDSSIGGFAANGNGSPDDAQIAAYMRTAEELAAQIIAGDPGALFECTWSEEKSARTECKNNFIEKLAPRLFRRPLTEAERERYYGQLYDGLFLDADAPLLDQYDFSERMRVVLQAMLQSPHFLYRVEFDDSGDGSHAAYALATRLSYTLWMSSPDAALYAAAADGSLLDEATYEAQVRRLLSHEKASRTFERFYYDWLALSGLVEIFGDEALAKDAVEETRRLVRLELSQEGTLKNLLTRSEGELNGRLAAHYASEGEDFGTLAPDAWALHDFSHRKGVLQRAGFLNQFKTEVYRGKFIRESVYCADPIAKPMDDASNAKIAEFEENFQGSGLDPRQLSKARMDVAPSCYGCHSQMDPFGWGFFDFDIDGTWRATYGETMNTVDTSGNIPFGDVQGDFATGAEMLEMMAQSEAVALCHTTTWTTMIWETEGFEPCMLQDISDRFVSEDTSLRTLLEQLVLHPVFRRIDTAQAP